MTTTKKTTSNKLPLIALATLVLAGGAGLAVAQPSGKSGPFGLLQHDANADGRLTRAEFDEAQRRHFNAIDANKDGTATNEEFRTYRDAEGKDRREEMVKARFDALDTDRNNQLSRTEFSARPEGDGARGPGKRGGPGRHQDGKRGPADRDQAARAVSFEDFSARGVEAFARADVNKDGAVTIAELQASRPAAR